MDADVATHLLHRCILGALSHTTRLLCTHRTEYLERADMVLLLEAGRLVRAGNMGHRTGMKDGEQEGKEPWIWDSGLGET